ncbi:MAG: SIMPL domain-containing protein [Armatimonadota bacterium]
MQTKARFWAAVLFLTAALLATFAAPANSAALESRKQAPKNERTIVVTGYAEVLAQPDTAVLRLGVETQDASAKAAAEANAKASQAVADAVKKLGISAENIQTAWYNVMPIYEEPSPRGEPYKIPKVIAYRVTNTVTVHLRGMVTKVGDVIDAALEAGANRVEGLSFELNAKDKFVQQAVRRAVQDAKRKAQTIAQALGVRLGEPILASEGYAYQVIQEALQFRMGAAGFGGTPISPGTVQITANVVVRFSFSGQPRR